MLMCMLWEQGQGISGKPESCPLIQGFQLWYLGSIGAQSPCAQGTLHRGTALAQSILKPKSARSVAVSRLMTPDPDTSLPSAWTSTMLPAPCLATTAVVHWKFVKTHTIPQTPLFQQISIFLLKPVLLEISQSSSTESHYFWNAFINIYCRVFLNDSSYRLWLSLIWQFANLTPFCILASWRKGKIFLCLSTWPLWFGCNMCYKMFPGDVPAWHSKTVVLRALLIDSVKILHICVPSFSYKSSMENKVYQWIGNFK